MDFEHFRQKLDEDANYNPEVFEDEINGKMPEEPKGNISGSEISGDTTPANTPQTKSAMGQLIEKYFKKAAGDNDCMKALDGFQQDLVTELTAYLKEEWFTQERDYPTRKDIYDKLKENIAKIADPRIIKIGTAIHDLGVQCQNARNTAGK